ncbi:MAG: hypothetical protein JWO11_329 [Nocardioides sp.]|nr:hypothetical protein [Nocardioides sp.]
MVIDVTAQRRRGAVRRLAVAVLAVVAGLAALGLPGLVSATGASFPAATPQRDCGPGARPETGIQGRVPLSDYTTGRVDRGYRCNTRQVSHQGSTGGFKVLRYTDRRGNTCAFYDSTLLFPKDLLFNAAKGLGVIVLDMNDPARPRQTATLTTPGMLSPHESLLLNKKRGLIGAVLGNPLTNVGILDLYDVRSDCRHPRLKSSTPTAILGHESGWSPDGKTYYAASTGGQTFVAIDVTDPSNPQRIFQQFGVNYHGLRLSDDGNTMYVANIGNPTGARISSGGLRILDVSEIQGRESDPKVHVVADLSWPEHSIPQVAEPFTRNGKPYLLEVDEFSNFGLDGGPTQANAPVGAARIIDISNPKRPAVVSELRLAVHQPAARKGAQQLDPGALVPVQGYAGHYCSVPKRDNPRIVACSFILSGLRIFDISRLNRPVEVGYFNEPTVPGTNLLNPTALGGFAMSQPAWDIKRRTVWYSDGNSGFYAVRLVNGVGKLLR